MRKSQGIPVSNGIAIGPCWIYRPLNIQIEQYIISDPAGEIARLKRAFEEAKHQLIQLQERALENIGAAEAAIFEAHQLFVDDPEFIAKIQTDIQNNLVNAEMAVEQAVELFAGQMLALEDDYFRERAQDIRDVGHRILCCLAGVSPERQQPPNPVIILADDLTPSDTVQFDRRMILGLCTRRGGPTSHTAILSRSLAVPAAVSVPLEIDDLLNGATVILDGSTGIVTYEPDENELITATQNKAEWDGHWQSQIQTAHEPAQTRDGYLVEIVANIGGIDDAHQALKFGAEGVGLLRTEFLYLDYERVPSQEEQTAVYRQIFSLMGDRPVVVRTLDIGGDKPVDYLDLQLETNPFLGWRAIRMMREKPELLLDQFRALISAASKETDLRIMIPMVSSIEEVLSARHLFDQARSAVQKAGLLQVEKCQFGIMVEVPSAALIAEHLADYVDFFSIGTNDLTQYALAVDRTNERVAYLASPFHPAVLHLIAQTITKAHQKGRWVGLCGEMAGDPQAAPLLLGLGLDEFSMAPASIPGVKALIRQLTLEGCQEMATKAIMLPSTGAVKDYLASWLENHT